jgi:hypothetical protein
MANGTAVCSFRSVRRGHANQFQPGPNMGNTGRGFGSEIGALSSGDLITGGMGVLLVYQPKHVQGIR